MEAIEREHPLYITRKAMWRKYRDLYAGGEQLKSNASEYLLRRQKEPADVYAERLYRVFYENYVGSIVDWYASTLFRREPTVTVDCADEATRRFYGEFVEDCDLRGSTIADLFRRQVVEALVSGAGYLLLDFPKALEHVENRAEEDAAGLSRGYLVEYAAEDVINWSHDELGNFEWVVIRTSAIRKQRIEEPDWKVETRWLYYDKESYRIYRRREVPGQQAPIELIDQGSHGLAKYRKVPLFGLHIPEGLWLLNKAALLQLEHFNKSNALGWALTMGLFAMPVIFSDREWSQIVGESYYIQLAPEDRFGWTEPTGNVFQIAAENLTRLQEEIYRVCYLYQAGGALSGASAISGISKMRDFSITQEVLRAYGDALKDQMKRVLKAVAAAREDTVSISVTGLDEFDIGDFAGELADAQGLLALGIGSKTLQTQIYKKLALKYLCDVRQDIKDQIVTEIDNS